MTLAAIIHDGEEWVGLKHCPTLRRRTDPSLLSVAAGQAQASDTLLSSLGEVYWQRLRRTLNNFLKENAMNERIDFILPRGVGQLDVARDIQHRLYRIRNLSEGQLNIEAIGLTTAETYVLAPGAIVDYRKFDKEGEKTYRIVIRKSDENAFAAGWYMLLDD